MLPGTKVASFLFCDNHEADKQGNNITEKNLFHEGHGKAGFLDCNLHGRKQKSRKKHENHAFLLFCELLFSDFLHAPIVPPLLSDCNHSQKVWSPEMLTVGT